MSLINDPSVDSGSKEDEEEQCELWSFYNSVFFAFTSITTIGYGRAAPQTQLGRGILLIYSFIGIPTNGILIGTIGAFFSIKVCHHFKCKDIHIGSSCCILMSLSSLPVWGV